nr:MAG TPA: hypothetical protein [Caudoviricetes sp.]
MPMKHRQVQIFLLAKIDLLFASILKIYLP